ncbi:hypothetical protein JOF53_008318 [Crossiella equi]|uniref:Amine oxidase domain-containing protein n=1 Tax=Crossiella equi TaxID=130796 RepID=A0ABS5ASB0_9PSEU|nr:hypothetical protein [Crossiella equi]
MDVVVLEAGDQVGGRVRTDVVDGVRLDRGFQILLPAYPELARRNDLPQLDLQPFRPGAFVRHGLAHSLFADPRGGLVGMRELLRQRLLGPRDLAALAALSVRDWLAPASVLLSAPDRTTAGELARLGLSERAVSALLRPFLSGVFLESGLDTSARFFHLVWRSFARGGAALPAEGMQALPRLLAERTSVRLESPVHALRADGVELVGGERLAADAVVVATDGDTAARLVPGVAAPAWHGVTTWYFRPPEPPLRDPSLVLDADGGPVVNTAVLSEVSPAYSPHAPLVQASTLVAASEGEIRSALGRLYETSAERWEVLGRYEIPRALPAMPAPHPLHAPVRVGPRRYVCGDYRATSSLQGALHSGRRAARAVLADLGRG